MTRKKIAVLFGGCSSEYEVSLQSAYAVIKNIDDVKYEPVLVGIGREGNWFLYEGSIEAILQDCWRQEEECYPMSILPDKKLHGFLVYKYPSKGGQDESGWREAILSMRQISVDAAFPVLHGKNGEDGTVQGVLELAGIPVIGCGTLSSAVCMDKDIAHRLAAGAGVRVPRSKIITNINISSNANVNVNKRAAVLEHAKREAANLGYPLFVKPLRAGSSFGITKVLAEEELSDALKTAFCHDTTVVMEEMINGFEVGCAVLGTEELFVGEVDEIELSEGFFDYTEKYTLKSSKIHVPARISQSTAEQIKAAAKIIYKSLGCSSFARVDMFLTPEGSIYFNEVNTIPGFTEHSRYPGMMKAAGLSFPEIVDRLIGMAAGD